VFSADKRYSALDIVQCDGASYIASRDQPGLPGHPDDGWQLFAGRGGRGPIGERGERGRKGERGARGEDAPTIIAWTIDRKNYRAVPTMSNGTQGAVLELRGLSNSIYWRRPANHERIEARLRSRFTDAPRRAADRTQAQNQTERENSTQGAAGRILVGAAAAARRHLSASSSHFTP